MSYIPLIYITVRLGPAHWRIFKKSVLNTTIRVCVCVCKKWRISIRTHSGHVGSLPMLMDMRAHFLPRSLFIYFVFGSRHGGKKAYGVHISLVSDKLYSTVIMFVNTTAAFPEGWWTFIFVLDALYTNSSLAARFRFFETVRKSYTVRHGAPSEKTRRMSSNVSHVIRRDS